MTLLAFIASGLAMDAVQTFITVKLFRTQNDPLTCGKPRASPVVSMVGDLAGKGLDASKRKRADWMADKVAAFLSRPGVARIFARLVLQAERRNQKNKWRKFI